MLEAERAGAKALVQFLNDWPRRGDEWKVLRKVHEDGGYGSHGYRYDWSEIEARKQNRK